MFNILYSTLTNLFFLSKPIHYLFIGINRKKLFKQRNSVFTASFKKIGELPLR